MLERSNNKDRRSRKGSTTLVLGCALVAAIAAAIFSIGAPASAVTVNVTAPQNDTWFGSDTAAIAGTATDPSPDGLVISGGAALQAGTTWNTTVNGSNVKQTFPNTETYSYFQDFSGLSGQVQIDDHWMWPLGGTLWSVAQDSASSNPPWLRHAGNHGDKIYWDVILPGPIISANLSFYYYCESNAALSAGVSVDGKNAGEDLILNQVGALGETALYYDVATRFAGSSAIHVRFWSTPINYLDDWWTACAIDSFGFVANFPRAATANDSFFDSFNDSTGGGAWSVWGLLDASWSDANVTGVSASPPALVHTGVANTSAWGSWGTATSIRNVTVAFHYQCEANASLSAFVGPYSSPTQILAGARGASQTAFSYDASSVSLGFRGFALGFAADAIGSANSRCGIDDVALRFTVVGNLNITYPGWYRSPAVDLGFAMNLTNVSWSGISLPATILNVSFRASLDNISFTAWQLVDGWGSLPIARLGRFVQFLANFTSVGGLFSASLSAFRLEYSAIVRLEWSSNGITWNRASGISNWSFVAPLVGGANVITVRATDTVGGTGSSMVTLRRDTFPPGAPGGPSGFPYSNSSSASWVWTAALDVGLGVDHYIVDLGTSPNGTDLGGGYIAWTPAYTALSLPEGATVYARVHAVDVVGLPGPIAFSSSPTLIDTLAPGPVQVPGGITKFTANTTLSWTWSPPIESGSGIDHYDVQLGSIGGSSDVFAGTVPVGQFSYSPTSDGVTYFLTVSAVDRAGNSGPARTTGGLRVDLSGPTNVEIVDEPATPTRNATAAWSWNPGVDNGSGLDHYVARLGSTPGASNVASQNTTSPSASFAVPGSGVFYFSVQAFDRVGNSGVLASAPPLAVDMEPPGPPVLELVSPFVNAQQVTIRWSSPPDGPLGISTGLSGFEVRVTAGGNPSSVTLVKNPSVVVNVTDGIRYLVAVSGVDAAGNVGPRAMINFTGDLSGPPVGVVTVSIVDPTVPEFEASWAPAADSVSGVRGYQVLVMAATGSTPIVNRTLTNETRVSWRGEFGVSYTVTVTAIDNSDNLGTAATSGAVAAPRPAENGNGSGSPIIYVGLGGAAAAVALVALVLAKRRKV
jgi:hypothetical protein